MQGLVLKIRAWWNIADKTAKTVTIVGVTFLLVTLIVTFVLASQPDYAVCYANLSSTDAGRVINKLKDLKVPFRIGGDGATVEVPKGQRDEVRMKLAAEGLPAESAGGIGNGWLDKSSISRTQSQEQIVNRVMLEEELQKTIQSLDTVQSARVHITMGQDGPFVDQQRPATADVVLHMAAGKRLASDQVSGVVHIVSHSVPGLDNKHVSIIDGDGTVLYDGTAEGPGGSGIYSIKRKEELDYASRMREEIERHLNQVLGPGKALVNVQCSMNFDTEQSDEVKHTPVVTDATVPTSATGAARAPGKTLVPLTDMTSQEGYGNGKSGSEGQVGAATNIAGAGGNSTTASGKSYTDFKRESQYVVDQQHLTTTKAPGKIESLSVAVLLDDSVKAPQEQAVTEYVNGVLGVPKGGPPKPNCNVTVAKTTFDQDQKKQVQKAAAAESSSRMMDKLFTIAPSLALIIAAVLVMRALGKPSIKLQAPELPEGFTPVLPHPGTVVVATESGGSGKVVVGGTPAQPQPAVIEVTAIPERFDIAKEQIVRMASEKPDTVALLIKSWMMEDRG